MARLRARIGLDDDGGCEEHHVAQPERSAKRLKTNKHTSELSHEQSLLLDSHLHPQLHHSVGSNCTNNPAPLKHRPGSIIRVKLINFVTYTSAEFLLGPSLNMIIGPNGTGKSTLVCAICLGLGWGPQHLGRAKELGEFVKHGAHQAEIEIELCGGLLTQDRNPIIQRLIRRQGNKSTFTLNGQQTTHREISRICQSFCIQIDNLCQFLPQDRVVEFAALSPVQLLEQTQRAAAPERMNQWHKQLKDLNDDEKIKLDARIQQRDVLRGLHSRHTLQRADVERMHERQILTNKLHAYERLRPFVSYRTAKERFEQAKAAVDVAIRGLRDLKSRIQPTLSLLKGKRVYLDRVEQVARERRNGLERLTCDAESLQRRKRQVQTEIDGKDKERTAEKDANRDRARQRDSLRHKMTALTEKMAEPPPDFDPAEFNERAREKTRASRELQIECQELDRQRKQIGDRIGSLEAQKQQLDQELHNLRSQAGQQSAKLKRLSYDTWKAWDWVQRNQEHLTGHAFGPPMVSCAVTDHRFSDAVESMFQRGDFLALTVSNRRDFGTLSKTFANMGLHDIHIREATRPRNSWNALVPLHELRKLNLSGWIIDYLRGPDAVLSALCDSLRLHQCAVTLGKHNDAEFEQVKASCIQRWVARRSSYQVSRRREYGDHAVSTVAGELKPSKCWTDRPIDAHFEQDLLTKMREIDHELEALNAQGSGLATQIRDRHIVIGRLEAERNEIDREKNIMQKEWGEFQGLRTKKDTCDMKLTQLSQAMHEMAQRLETIDTQVDRLNAEDLQLTIDYVNSLSCLVDRHQDACEADVCSVEARSELHACEERSQDIKRKMKSHEESIEALKAEKARLKGNARQLEAEVDRINNERSTEEEDLVVHIQECISSEDLEAEIEIFQSRLTLLHAGDPNAVREFEKRGKKIEELEQRLRDTDAELEGIRAQIEAVKLLWVPELDALVQKISDAFSFNFAKIGCAGQVSIYKADQFSDWAIQIQVKFREQEQLCILDSHRQSGGERAVSTIFYLMALQSLARSPFRVVDEINQGMDPRNERMVHERMVDIACQEDTAQYFLITPKLLHGLKVHPRMTVHCIASGEYMPPDYRELDFNALVDVAMRTKGKETGRAAA